MESGVGVNVALGVTFLAVGGAASILQYWLWTFPMVPDPSGVDPNGVTTAPKFWRYTHRLLGYAFAVVYLVLMSQMVVRIWQYNVEGWTPVSVIHSILGLLVGLLLIGKVLILRGFQRFGNRLLIVGSLVMLSSIGAVALPAYPAWRVMTHPGDDQARQIILNDCTTCHGLGVVAGEGEEAGKWYEVLDEMAEKAAKRGMTDPSHGQRDRLVAFLASLNPGGHGGGEGDENSGGSRTRRREDED